ncbi:MAG: McrC family protein [Methylococcaceae bacterium]
MSELSIREFGYIIQKSMNQELNNDEPSSSLDVCAVNPEAWEYLEGYAYNSDKENRFIRPRSYNGKKALQVVNFVGVLSLPGDIHLEILPKTSKDGQDNIEVRKLLVKMLSEVYELPFIEHTKANIQVFKRPLLEVLITWFLQDLANVVRKGIRKDYERIEAEEKFLKGRLLVSQQINQPVSRRHLFRIAYDIFSENRAENRLIHSALVQVAKWSKCENNQKLARELRFAFNEIPKSTDYKTDFGQWRNSRDMISYKPLLYWVKLILNQQSPFSIKGDSKGISFLFPMETLFEKYVAKILEKNITKGYEVNTQVKRAFLSEKPPAFLLKPDLAIYKENGFKKNDPPLCILDTKWKLIDQYAQYDNGKEDKKSGISQSDMYQMFAYGHKYLAGEGKLVLIYPKWNKFDKAKHFHLGGKDLVLGRKGLDLDVFPFDLDEAEASATLLFKQL